MRCRVERKRVRRPWPPALLSVFISLSFTHQRCRCPLTRTPLPRPASASGSPGALLRGTGEGREKARAGRPKEEASVFRGPLGSRIPSFLVHGRRMRRNPGHAHTPRLCQRNGRLLWRRADLAIDRAGPVQNSVARPSSSTSFIPPSLALALSTCPRASSLSLSLQSPPYSSINLAGTTLKELDTDSAASCCAACGENDGCLGYNWCSAEAGCDGGYAKGTCHLKSWETNYGFAEGYGCSGDLQGWRSGFMSGMQRWKESPPPCQKPGEAPLAIPGVPGGVRVNWQGPVLILDADGQKMGEGGKCARGPVCCHTRLLKRPPLPSPIIPLSVT